MVSSSRSSASRRLARDGGRATRSAGALVWPRPRGGPLLRDDRRLWPAGHRRTGESGRTLSGASAGLGISTASGISATSGISALLLVLLPALLALFPALLPCFPVLLALLLALLALLLALLALFPALLPIHGPVLVLPTTAALAIALASGFVSVSAVPASAWLVGSVSPAHEFLLVLSIAQDDSVSCTRSGTGVTLAGVPVSGAVRRA
jgi:hypothetical protein